jgi:DNA-binding SARP family transcriptional activator
MHSDHCRAGAANGTDLAFEAGSAELECAAFRDFPHGLVLFDARGRVVSCNIAAAGLLDALAGGRKQDCCSLFGCGTEGTELANGCVVDLAFARDGALPEVRLDLSTPNGPQVLWILASRLAGSHHVVVQMRSGPAWDRRRRTDPSWMSGARLRIRALGSTTVELGDSALGGQWLDQRTGQLLKYLVVERHRSVSVDEIGESLWPDAGYGVANTVRYYIHSLRRTLEPRRGSRQPSRFIVSSGARYRLDLDRVEVDADDFETCTVRGFALSERDTVAAAAELERGLALYRGEFLADAPYAEWAIAERHRLHELACSGLRALAAVRLRHDDGSAATACFERLAAMQPYDEDVHRRLMEMKIAEGRRSDALRHYAILRARIKRSFGHEPSFRPTDVRAFVPPDAVGALAESEAQRL